MLDWGIILGSFLVSLIIGVVASRKAGKSSSDFFLSGRSMPWWLLGISMVATTFAADTPNLVAEIVRTNGVSGNWVWWAFLLTGMLTTFVYAKLWRRSGVLTDLEFYEIRYSGPVASFLRGFRALYLGVVFNVLVMAAVCLAGIKLSAALLGLSPVQTLLIVSVITVAYGGLGGLCGVILTDFFQFGLAITGSIWACIYVLGLPEIGGLSDLVSHPNVVGKISMLPDLTDPSMYVPLLLVPLALTFTNPHSHLNGGTGGGFDWVPGYFLVRGTMLFAAAVGVQLALRHASAPTMKIAAILAILAAFALVWVELAVGGVSQLAVALAMPCPATSLVDPALPPVRLAIGH